MTSFSGVDRDHHLHVSKETDIRQQLQRNARVMSDERTASRAGRALEKPVCAREQFRIYSRLENGHIHCSGRLVGKVKIIGKEAIK